MEIEGIDDWKLPRRKLPGIIHDKLVSQRLTRVKCDLNLVCAFIALGSLKLPSVTNRSHKQYNFVQSRLKSEPIFAICQVFPQDGKSIWFSFRVSTKSTMSMLQPQMKAPEFKGTAVVNGEFKEVKTNSLSLALLWVFILPCISKPWNIHLECRSALSVHAAIFLSLKVKSALLFVLINSDLDQPLRLCWEVCGSLLLPPGLHLCLSNRDYCFQWQVRNI